MTLLLLKAKQIWTWFLLLAEELSVALWKPVTWVFAFCGLWIFDPFSGLGDWVSYILSVGFFIGLGYFLFQVRVSMPSPHAVDRRLERDSGIKHRPLERDEPSSLSDNGTLWDRNRVYLARRLKAMKWARPRALLAARDPYALRMLGVLFLLGGVLVSGAVSISKIHDGVFPFVPSWVDGAERPPKLTLWITPPDYTGAKQVIVYEAGDTLQIPAFSSVKASIRGGIGVPVLRITSGGGDEAATQEWAFERIDDKQYSLEFTLPDDLKGAARLSVRQSFLTKLSQDLLVIEDHAPEIFEQEAVKSLPDGGLRFSLAVRDDYGAQSVTMHMKLDQISESSPMGDGVSETRIVISAPNEMLDIRPTYDLTHHNWVGVPVIFFFEVHDARGQVAFSTPIHTILPERRFQHPIAQQLIAYRKRLIWSPYADHITMGQELDIVLTQPSLFQGDLMAALAMRAASSRLYYTHQHDEAEMLKTARGVVKLLWDTALRIEDGDLSLATRNLRNAQQDLQEALQDPNVSDARKAQLMAELKQAMAEYFKELQREMQKRMAGNENMFMQTPLLSADSMADILSSKSLSDFLEKMEQQIMSGEIKDAQQMLSQLGELMQMMNPNAIQEMPKDMQMMQEGIGELQALIDQQQDLLDRTTQQSAAIQRNLEKALRELYKQPEDRTIFPPIDTGAKKIEQDSLLAILGALIVKVAEKIDPVPEEMGMAESAMQDSSKKLAMNMPVDSMVHQQSAIDYLKSAKDDLVEQLSARMQQMISFSFSPNGGQAGGRDPLGRPYDPEGDQSAQNSDVQVPDEMNRRRVQEIQKLLRDRSGEYDRPEAERAYYRRLLKIF